ncbi:MAG TPA: class I SAM-dependent methyltransferase [Rhodothermales bacterium]|nr:class I SAM-dependent methyltransferase [Rhodothermales bacterium]
MESIPFDEARAEVFAENTLTMFNHGATALMVSIGHRTGLFDTMEQLPSSTSHQIAEASGLNERYVREWLGAMTTAGITEYRRADDAYRLPPEHAAFLTRASSPNNLAAFAQYFAVLGGVEDEVVEAFTTGAGVPYSSYNRFHEVMAEDSGQTVLPALKEHILPLVPGLVERMEASISVLDVGCGSGRALNLMAELFPRSRFTGYDFSDEAISRGRAEAEAKDLGNVELSVRDAAEPFEDGAFDLITAFDAIHDQGRPAEVLRNIHAALKPGGTFLMQDIAGSSHVYNNLEHPAGPLLYAISCMHCMSVSLAAGGPGLGAMWGKEKALEMLGEAGFRDVRVEQLPHDFQNYYYIMHKQDV